MRPTAPAGNAPRVLLVEDDPFVRELVAVMLRGAKCVVDDVNGPLSALACFDPADAHDLLVTDLLMPAMTGRQLAEVLRLERPDLRVLYLSGDDAVVSDDPPLASRSTQSLQKPFTAADLEDAVATLLAA